MDSPKKMFKLKNIGCSYLYFYIHLITEIICFYFLTKVTNNSLIVWIIPFIYDGLAFVPQAILGRFNDKFPKINLALIGILLMILALITFYYLNSNVYLSLLFLCLGNACVHVSGAEVTIKNSNGKLSHSAIFVAGGSFGVIFGKLLAHTFVTPWMILILSLTTIPFILLAHTYEYSEKRKKCDEFNYINKNLNPYLIIFLAVFVVIIRGYMGYGIPTSWNKTTLQTVLLFSTMAVGKAMGGILSDYFGIRKIAVLSTILAIPFLCIGDHLMIVSLIGVMFFSMTMSITLAILVSALPKSPGLAFGLTTIGLFIGTAPIFFIKITNFTFNLILIIVLSLLCTIILRKILENGDANG